MSQVRLAWNANSETNIAGYKMYWGTASGVYNAIGSPKNMGNVTSGGVDIVETASWFFALKAVNTSGLESAFSNEVSRQIELGLSFGKAN